jgi:hypothetical protein
MWYIPHKNRVRKMMTVKRSFNGHVSFPQCHDLPDDKHLKLPVKENSYQGIPGISPYTDHLPEYILSQIQFCSVQLYRFFQD